MSKHGQTRVTLHTRLDDTELRKVIVKRLKKAPGFGEQVNDSGSELRRRVRSGNKSAATVVVQIAAAAEPGVQKVHMYVEDIEISSRFGIKHEMGVVYADGAISSIKKDILKRDGRAVEG